MEVAEAPAPGITNSCEFLIGEPENTTPQAPRGFKVRYPLNKRIVLIYALICASVVLGCVAFAITIWNKEPQCLKRIVVFHGDADEPIDRLHLATHVVFSELEVQPDGSLKFETPQIEKDFFELKKEVQNNHRVDFLVSIGGPHHMNVSRDGRTAQAMIDHICQFVEQNHLAGVNLNFELPITEGEKKSFMKILQRISDCIGFQGRKPRVVGLNMNSIDDGSWGEENREDPLHFHISGILRSVDFVNLDSASYETVKTQLFVDNKRKFNFKYNPANLHQYCGNAEGIWISEENRDSWNHDKYDHICHNKQNGV